MALRRITKELAESFRTLGDIYYKMGQTETAIPYYEKYLAINPKDEEVRKMLDAIKAALKKKTAPR